MNIYQAVVSYYFDTKINKEVILISGNNYSDAVARIEDYYENDLIEFRIMELDSPVHLDQEQLDIWQKFLKNVT